MKSLIIFLIILCALQACEKYYFNHPEKYAGEYTCDHYGYYWDTITNTVEFSHYFGKDTIFFSYDDEEDNFILHLSSSDIEMGHNQDEDELTYQSGGTNYWQVVFFSKDSMELHYQAGIAGGADWFGKKIE